LVGYKVYESCVPYSYIYSNPPSTAINMYGIYCPIKTLISSARTSLIHATKFTMPSIYGRNFNDVTFSVSTKSGKIV
jgi:hypothetical protein